MGFTDMSIMGSDTAADMARDIGDMLAKKLAKESKTKENEFNTDGIDNVAMFFEEVICRAGDVFNYNDNLIVLANNIANSLKERIKELSKKEYKNDESAHRFICRYRQMLKAINKWIENNS